MATRNQREMHEENQSKIATIGTRVDGIESDIHDINQRLDRDIPALRSDITRGLAAIAEKLEQRGRPQWQALSVMLAVCIAVGGLAYWPIREGMSAIRIDFQESIREGKQDRKEVSAQSIERDRLIWNSVLPLQRQVDRMEGELRARHTIAP